ncbi:PQQ-dependent sugar dehydrogenase [Gordonia sp. PKS22-38]|uniref:PQQ-dependent sugar dehydrogenase n=1 Tax=Gordonia prachuapensis TaxID=3115651 RepID=A0ABU7MMW3_9ACTN|nr:PQQ-dependent sugar dehydrogenase [Gordonia sp. PKS22-38]
MDRRQFLTAGAVAGLSVWVASCADADQTAAPSTPPSSPDPATPAAPATEPTVSGVVAEGLNVPWAIAFLQDGSALVTQRDDATIVRVSPSGDVATVGDVSDAAPRGEGGLQGIALAPDESAVFVYYTTENDNRLVRMDFDGNRVSNPRPLITGLDMAFNHHGGPIVRGPDGYLYVAVGDAAEPDVAQDVNALNGKILRVDDDGRPAPDNPFDNEVWSMGHRNNEGLAFDASGRLWASEFGQDRRDELNLIERGGNYGWPEFEGESDDPRFISPAVTWSTDEASPAGLAIIGGTAYMAALRGRRLWTIPLGDGSTSAVGEPRSQFTDTYGRLRAVAAAPDGSLWVSTSNTDGRGRPATGDDRILRVTV